ncbi:cutinase [Mycobacterium sp. MAA66]|uniref:cutinase family protein n=1 Tax=Mycobacterium sp. MAA66 TaxID=3156297 RepID=UPI0035132E93
MTFRYWADFGRRLGLGLAALIAGLTATVGTPTASPATAAGNPSCTDVEVIFARGTNEAPGVGVIGQAFVDALNARLQGRTVDVYAVNYPASYDFSTGVQGVIDASHQIESIVARCPGTKIVLGGYSQGAAVAGYTIIDSLPPGFVPPDGITGPMPAAIASHIAAVVMFGTPQPWVVNVADRDAPPMSIGPIYTAKMLQLCAPGDPICASGGLDRSAHHAYVDNGMTDQAADFAARAV